MVWHNQTWPPKKSPALTKHFEEAASFYQKKKAYSSEIEKQKHPQQVNSLNERVQFSILVAETPIAPIKLHLPDAETRKKKKKLFHPASVRSVRPASVTSHGLGSEPESSL